MIGDLGRYAAVNARVRALLPTLLGRRGLETLYGYPTSAALLDVLARTPYGPGVLAAPQPDTALRRRLVDVGGTLLDLLSGREQAFIRQYLQRQEVDTLKLVIRAVHLHLPWEQVAPHVVALAALATVDAEALAQAPDLAALAARLDGTPYAAPLAAALPRLEAVGPFAAEVALELDYYDRLWAAAAALAASDAERAHAILGMLFDLLNLAWATRYRETLGLPPDEVMNCLLRHGRYLTSALQRTLLEQPAATWDSALARTPYAAGLAEVPARGFDAAWAGLWSVLASDVQRGFRDYPFHIGVPLGFVVTQEIEIRDLQVLLAAKRVGLGADEAFTYVASVRN